MPDSCFKYKRWMKLVYKSIDYYGGYRKYEKLFFFRSASEDNSNRELKVVVAFSAD